MYPGTGVRTWKPIMLIIGGQEGKRLLRETLECTQYDGVQHFHSIAHSLEDAKRGEHSGDAGSQANVHGQ